MRVHIDGDMLKYSCGFAAEKGEYIISYISELGDEVQEAYTYKKDYVARLKRLGNPAHTIEFARRPEPVENALHNVKVAINDIKNELAADDVVVYLSGPTNYRTSLATLRVYKGNRDPTHKPIHGPAIVDYITSKYANVISDGEEADDVIGYTHYEMWEQDPNGTVIASFDKDLDMIPGLHYNNKRGELYNISPDYAMYLFFKQVLTGDSTDNVQGIPKVGPVKATTILSGLEDNETAMYGSCLAAYEGYYGVDDGEKYLLENARLLWIRRRPGELWNPPKLPYDRIEENNNE